jgi:hypothetical protein
LFIGHVHEEWSNEEGQSLAVTNLCIKKAKTFEDMAEHALAITVGVAKHVNAWKTSAQIFPNKHFVRAGFAAELVEPLLEVGIAGARHALPDNTSKWWRNAFPNLVG